MRPFASLRALGVPASLLWCALASPALAQEPAAGDPAGPAPVETPAPTPAAVESAAPSRVTGRSPVELQAFKDAQQRFTDRMKELEADTRSFIDEREAEERAKLSAGYDESIKLLDDDVRARRLLAVERFEQFLQRYPDVPYASHVRFRLADLYWEDARETWLAKSADYYLLEEKLLAEGRADEIPEAPLMDLSGPVALYERIIADNLHLPEDQQYEYLDGTFYSLGFVYREENAPQYDDAKARQAFRDLIHYKPGSQLADEAHLNLGNFEFEENDFDEAIAEYRHIYDKGSESRVYDSAVYQLAWAFYKLDVYNTPRPGDPPDATALALFTRLLDFSAEQHEKTGRKSEYAPDAIKFMAFSFADIAEDLNPEHLPGGVTPVTVAQEWFAKVGPREYEWDVYVALAKALTDYNRFSEAIVVFEALQTEPRWKNRPENPEFQIQVVKLWASGPEPDLAKSAAARIVLTERYNDRSEWWRENRYNPEALSKARNFIEESLADVAIEYLLAAQQTGDAAKYMTAAEKFREYLDRFPMSDDYYQMQWYLAISLAQAGDPSAIPEFESLIKSKAHHPFADGAIVQLVQARRQSMVAAHGDTGVLEPTATVERTYTTQWKPDAPINVYGLAAEHKAFLEVADKVLVWQFTPPTDPQQPDFGQFVSANFGALKYVPAQILYVHQRFDEARPRLLDIIQDPRTKCSDEASYAAKYLVDSYVAEGNLAEVRKYTKEFILHPPGCASALAMETGGVFGTVLEQSTFKLAVAQAKEASDPASHMAAADAFLAFMKEFPQSEYRDEALYNAANEYDIAGKVERANELYEQYVNDYPKNDLSAGLYFRIAANYESVFELGKAVDYYARLLKYFPNDPVAAPDAMYNVAFLKVGLGDHAGAAKGFEAYERTYPEREDAVETLWQAGEQWKLVGASQAIAFYDSFRKTYGARNPNYLLQCDMEIAEMYRKQGNTKKTTEYLDLILRDWESIESAGRTGEVKLEGRHAAAESAFRAVQAKYDVLVKPDKLSGNDEKDMTLLADKEVALGAFRDDPEVMALATRFGDFEYTTAAFYLRARALLYYAELGFQLKPPPGLSEDEQFAFQEILDQQVFPKFYDLQEKAKSEYQQLIELAKDKKLWSEWVTKSQEELNNLDPFAFPVEKLEVRGAVDSSIQTRIVPIAVDPAKKASAATEAP